MLSVVVMAEVMVAVMVAGIVNYHNGCGCGGSLSARAHCMEFQVCVRAR